MKNILLKINLILLLVSFTAFGQDYAKADDVVRDYPKSFSDTDKLAGLINKDFKRDHEKARAIFTWIATNVKYDLAAYGVNERPIGFSYSTQQEKIEKQKKLEYDLALKTLRSRRGVCQGYSTLYKILAEKTGLEAVIVTGTSKSHPAHIGKMPGASDHAWNAVKIDGQWKLLDVTFGAGAVSGNPPVFQFRYNDKYFFTDPKVFFLNHYPDDEKWLFTQATAGDFANLPLYYGNYHMGGYEFLTPAMGTYTAKPSVLTFKVKNLKPEDRLAYAFSRERIFRKIVPVRNGDTAEFQVPLSAASAGTLTIYVNQKSAVAYRIEKP